MHLSIITINFRKPSLTIRFLQSLYTEYQEKFSQNEWEIIVVDNFSEDTSVAILEKEVKEKKYKNVHVAAHKINNGFGGGNNFGARLAKGKVLLFLNNDTIVGEGLGAMLSFFQEEKHMGVLGGVLQNMSGTPQHSYDRFYTLPFVFLLLVGLQRIAAKRLQRPQKVDWVKGACLMIAKDLFERLNGFDKNIFMYTEDMELCYRVGKMGKEIWTFPGVVIRHEDQGSSSRTFAIINIYAGITYFYKKHKSWVEVQLVKLLLQTKAVFLILLGKLTNNSYLVTTYEKALDVIR